MAVNKSATECISGRLDVEGIREGSASSMRDCSESGQALQIGALSSVVCKLTRNRSESCIDDSGLASSASGGESIGRRNEGIGFDVEWLKGACEIRFAAF